MEKQKYKMIQVTDELHALLKGYCDKHGYKMGALVSNLIKLHIKK